MERKNAVVKVEVITDCRLFNLHNNFYSTSRTIMKISFKNGKFRELDLLSKVDLTDIDYIEVIYPERSKRYLLFKETDDMI